MNFDEVYKRETFIDFLRTFLPDDFKYEEENILLENINNKKIKSAIFFGESSSLNLSVYEFEHESEKDPRVTITNEIFKFMKDFSKDNVLAIVKSKNSKNYRLSLATRDFVVSEDSIVEQKSNPRRHSFVLGPDAKVKTPQKFLIEKGHIKDLEDLKNRFSVEVVNKEFYQQISRFFNELVEKAKLPDNASKEQKQNFAIRLIGRIIFCWFLKKKTINDKPLISDEILSSNAVKNNDNYFHIVLENLFFQILNTPVESRKVNDNKFKDIPFLNGGLFEPKTDDYYEFDGATQLSRYINTVKISNEWFEYFFEVLETYNFTIDENTPFDVELSVDPEMLGRVFENLLAEINPDTGESARHATGSYYTPRQIVDYMINESLGNYLINKTSLEEEIVEKLLSYEEDEIKLEYTGTDKIINAIDELKIIDTACGSGAFLMDALQKISWILHKVDPGSYKWREKQFENLDPAMKKILEDKLKDENEEFIRKLSLIENTIYGVDSQEIAVELAKLRVFLSLIVDSNIDNKKYNMGIKPLPNLEFKFVCADSLISLPKNNKFDIDAGNKDLIDKIIDNVKNYFSSYGDDKETAKKEIEDIQRQLYDKIFLYLIEDQKGIESKKSFALTKWEPFSSRPSNWFDQELMFGVKDGFDIVIGNPPYIQLQKDQGKLAEKYKNQNFETYDRMGDIYTLFYERGMQLLKDNGYLCFITSNKWMRAGYGEKLRQFILKYNPIIIIDLGSGVFESATVDTSILLIQKSKNQNQLKGISLQSTNGSHDLSNLVKTKSIPLPNMSKEVWFIGSNVEQRLKEKIEKIGKPLKEWKDVNIYYGIKTGLNEAFIITTQKRDGILANCKDEDERERTESIIKPILRGRDINRYSYKWAGLWIIGTFPTLNLNIDDYPAIKKYFLVYFDIRQLEQSGKKYPQLGFNARKKTSNKWFETQDQIAYYSEFEKEKILYSEIVRKPQFCIDTKSFYIEATAFLMTTKNMNYICGLLNSKAVSYFFKKFYAGGGLGEKGYRYKKDFLEKAPFPQISHENIKLIEPIKFLVDEIISNKQF
ncbi:MAG: Eco57I restriction-modification methylase domain-containing protein [Thermotogae bacterium]|nr:Eco57I restriction-modification methylase domain-containing protein [Thermotogota bacterium]